ncbi:MAG: ComF family protein [Candidatus Saccharicenans sp.]
MKEAIILFKYKGYENLSRPLASLAYKALADKGIFSGIDFILPVPLHKKREKARGFNQSELLARELSRLSSIPTLSGLLVKIKNTPAQVSLEATDREVNLKGAFQVKKIERIKGQSLLLIDDVFTTGSTLKECSLVLYEAGAKEIKALTLARA